MAGKRNNSVRFSTQYHRLFWLLVLIPERRCIKTHTGPEVFKKQRNIYGIIQNLF